VTAVERRRRKPFIAIRYAQRLDASFPIRLAVPVVRTEDLRAADPIVATDERRAAILKPTSH
jgi:hypothetical protein